MLPVEEENQTKLYGIPSVPVSTFNAISFNVGASDKQNVCVLLPVGGNISFDKQSVDEEVNLTVWLLASPPVAEVNPQ